MLSDGLELVVFRAAGFTQEIRALNAEARGPALFLLKLTCDQILACERCQRHNFYIVGLISKMVSYTTFC